MVSVNLSHDGENIELLSETNLITKCVTSFRVRNFISFVSMKGIE